MTEINKKSTPSPCDGMENTFSLTFNIETLRVVSYLALIFMIVVGVIVTKIFVNVHPHDPEQTVIFLTFGFNHICDVFDHQPSRTISALLVLLFIIPMSAFVIFSYLRTSDACLEGRVPKGLQAYNKAITPFVFLAVCFTYMWFVNSPDGKYGFVGHYLPYVALQLALGLLAIQEVAYLAHTGALPFGASARAAKIYLVLLIAVTIACQVAVFSLLLGFPILDSRNSPAERVVFQMLMYFYSFLAVAMPLYFAAINRKNHCTNTISFG